jgi:hypothetical protein
LSEGDVRSFVGHKVVEHLVLEHEDPKAANTAKRPNSVLPHKGGDAALLDGKLTALLPPLSWNVIRCRIHRPADKTSQFPPAAAHAKGPQEEFVVPGSRWGTHGLQAPDRQYVETLVGEEVQECT